MGKLVTGEFNITQADCGTKANGTAGVMSEIYDFEVPYSTMIRIRPSDYFSAYFKDASAESIATDTYEIIITDPNGITTDKISSGMYNRVKEFADQNKVCKFKQERLVKAGWHIKIMFKATTVLVNASCYFNLTRQRLAEL
jgi:hypothetical protein